MLLKIEKRISEDLFHYANYGMFCIVKQQKEMGYFILIIGPLHI